MCIVGIRHRKIVDLLDIYLYTYYYDNCWTFVEIDIVILIENVDCSVGCEKNWKTIYTFIQCASSKFEFWILGW